ncbi:MAG TPA: AraC family transcriptional regulator [Aggregatilineales bacterium]|nr:AraC family transcriptional regulator [Aggregatilineales bacterium]
MSAVFEHRSSESPYVEIIWRGRVEKDYSPLCPADVRWNLLFVKNREKVRISAEGPTTRSRLKNQFEGNQFLVIKFKLGVYMPYLPAIDLVDGDAVLPKAAGKSFSVNGSAWQLPSYENVETFVDRLVRSGVLIVDPLVSAVLQDQPQELSDRSVRRRFLYATGLTPRAIRQIERAQHAAALLEKGASILDATYEAGYADQPHLTRSLKRFYGQTPAQLSRVAELA